MMGRRQQTAACALLCYGTIPYNTLSYDRLLWGMVLFFVSLRMCQIGSQVNSQISQLERKLFQMMQRLVRSRAEYTCSEVTAQATVGSKERDCYICFLSVEFFVAYSE